MLLVDVNEEKTKLDISEVSLTGLNVDLATVLAPSHCYVVVYAVDNARSFGEETVS